MGFYEKIPHASPVQAEIMALRRGLTMTAANNIKPLHINIDSLAMTQLLNKTDSHYHNLLYECRSLILILQSPSPVHIFKEQIKLRMHWQKGTKPYEF